MKFIPSSQWIFLFNYFFFVIMTAQWYAFVLTCLLQFACLCREKPSSFPLFLHISKSFHLFSLFLWLCSIRFCLSLHCLCLFGAVIYCLPLLFPAISLDSSIHSTDTNTTSRNEETSRKRTWRQMMEELRKRKGRGRMSKAREVRNSLEERTAWFLDSIFYHSIFQSLTFLLIHLPTNCV